MKTHMPVKEEAKIIPKLKIEEETLMIKIEREETIHMAMKEKVIEMIGIEKTKNMKKIKEKLVQE